MPPFTGSDVPLEEDILKPEVRRDFFPTWLEWAAQNFEQIFRSASLSNTSVTSVMFTVPENKVLYITAAQVCGVTGNMSIVNEPSGINFLRAGVSNFICPLSIRFSSRIATSTQDFTMPIKIDSGIDVRLTPMGTATNIIGAFQGFLIDKPIS